MIKLLKNAPLGLLSWLIAVAVWLMWEPLAVEGGEEYKVMLWQGNADTLAHILLLAPIAVVLAVAAHKSDSRRPILQALAISTFIALLLEFGQWWVEGRGVSLDDFLASVLGAALVVWLTISLMRRGFRSRNLLVAVAGVVCCVVLLGSVYEAVLFNRNFRLTEWDPLFQVIAGEEFGDQRNYEGRVLSAQICAGEPTHEVCIEAGASANDRRLLTGVAQQSQRCGISAWINSSSNNQTGTARIITFSLGVGNRNITLGQKGRDLVFRIRTPQTGPNGVRPQFILSDAVHYGKPTQVRAVFDKGAMTMTAESQTELVSAKFRPGLLHNWLLKRSLFNGGAGELRVLGSTARNLLTTAFVLIGPVGFSIGWLLRTRWLIASLACPALAAAGLWTIDSWALSTLSPSLFELTAAAGAAGLGVAFAAWDLSPGLGRSRT